MISVLIVSAHFISACKVKLLHLKKKASIKYKKKMNLKFEVNNLQLTSENKIITGTQILEIAGFMPVVDFDLYKKIKGQEYEPIQYDENVDLEEPGIEKFKVSRRAKLTFYVDDEEYTTMELALTPIDIFKIIDQKPTEYYLKQIIGNMEITYKNDETKSIDMIGELKFITCKREPTTVS